MRPTQFTPDTAAALLRKQKIASLPELMAMLGTDALCWQFPLRSGKLHITKV